MSLLFVDVLYLDVLYIASSCSRIDVWHSVLKDTAPRHSFQSGINMVRTETEY